MTSVRLLVVARSQTRKRTQTLLHTVFGSQRVVADFGFRSLYDTDDEVRDRATFYYHMLSSLEDAQKLMNQTLGT